MKMPKLVCLQLFNKWRLEPLRQKEKKCWYTNQQCISIMREKGNCQLTEIPACPCWCQWHLDFWNSEPFFLQEAEGQTCCCRSGAGCWLLIEVWDMDKFSPAHTSTSPWLWRWLPWYQWPQYRCGTFSCDLLHPCSPVTWSGGCVRAN